MLKESKERPTLNVWINGINLTAVHQRPTSCCHLCSTYQRRTVIIQQSADRGHASLAASSRGLRAANARLKEAWAKGLISMCWSLSAPTHFTICTQRWGCDLTSFFVFVSLPCVPSLRFVSASPLCSLISPLLLLHSYNQVVTSKETTSCFLTSTARNIENAFSAQSFSVNKAA